MTRDRCVVIVAIILSACGPTQGPTVYHGTPDGETTACSWNVIHKDSGECIAAGKRYRCIKRTVSNDEHYWIEVSCAPKAANPIYNILDRWSK